MDAADPLLPLLASLDTRLARLERDIGVLLERQDRPPATADKEAYTVAEAAARLGRAVWTVRQACNLGRIRAEKVRFGRGKRGEWRIPHAELVRVQTAGWDG